ncbi:hypothetical protein [Aureispira anguillae]|uniref:Uncharacterized protein n=1 Tax=Aureispira anguillae TaxID=2864201 RepID=A0A916DTT8_9BACT|nr:hypothetical protein [Aureispira anguillae]BDS12087.1 hypothetical protein AsAng_0028020 [Aureispira anguillae]
MTYLLMAQFGFIFLTLSCLIIIYYQLKKSLQILDTKTQHQILRRYIWGLSIWIALLSCLSILGILSDFTAVPPKLPFFLVIPIIVLILIFRSPHLDTVLQNTPSTWFFNIQFFRFFVEILLWFLFLAEVLPERMTFEGANFDIIAGITGPIFACLCFANGKKNKTLAIIWNIVSLLLLVNIVSIALLTMPTPFQVFTNEDNTIVGTFPVVFLPSVLVPIAYYMHCLSLRQLLKQ